MGVLFILFIEAAVNILAGALFNISYSFIDCCFVFLLFQKLVKFSYLGSFVDFNTVDDARLDMVCLV